MTYVLPSQSVKAIDMNSAASQRIIPSSTHDLRKAHKPFRESISVNAAASVFFRS